MWRRFRRRRAEQSARVPHSFRCDHSTEPLSLDGVCLLIRHLSPQDQRELSEIMPRLLQDDHV